MDEINMLAQIEVDNMKNILGKIKHIAKEDRANNIFAFGLFEFENDECTITLKNLANTVIATIPAKVKIPGKLIVKVATLFSLLNTFSNIVDFEYSDTDKILWIKNDTSFCQIKTGKVEHFPKTNNNFIPDENQIVLKSSILKSGFKKALKFAEEFEGNMLSGININISENKLQITGCNGQKMALITHSLNNTKDISYTLSKQAVELILGAGDDNISLKTQKNTCLIEFEKIKIFTQLLYGQYPDMAKVIPTNLPIKISIDKKELNNILNRIEISETVLDFCRVYFEVKNNILTISSPEQKNKTIIYLSTDCPNINFVLNRKLLQTLLTVIENQEITFETDTTKNSVLILENKSQYLLVKLMEKKG